MDDGAMIGRATTNNDRAMSIGDWSDIGRLVRRRAANAAAVHDQLLTCLTGSPEESARGQARGSARVCDDAASAGAVSRTLEGRS